MKCQYYNCDKQATFGFRGCSKLHGYEINGAIGAIKFFQKEAGTKYTDKLDDENNVIAVENSWTDLLSPLKNMEMGELIHYSKLII